MVSACGGAGVHTAIEFGKEGVTRVEDSSQAVPCRTVSSQQAACGWLCSGSLGHPCLGNIGSNLRLRFGVKNKANECQKQPQEVTEMAFPRVWLLWVNAPGSFLKKGL